VSGSSLSLAGSLLAAHPNLLDPNFRRAVLLLGANDADGGSFGLVLNRPANKKAGELLTDHQDSILAEIPVFFGGPVARDQLLFASFQWNPNKQAVECESHLVIEQVEAIAEEDLSAVRAFVGYTGWSSGQLEAELAQKAWLIEKAQREILDVEKCLQLWPSIMRGLGPWFRLMAAAPDDPSKN
jgi:putative transcriptional regulator